MPAGNSSGPKSEAVLSFSGAGSNACSRSSAVAHTRIRVPGKRWDFVATTAEVPSIHLPTSVGSPSETASPASTKVSNLQATQAGTLGSETLPVVAGFVRIRLVSEPFVSQANAEVSTRIIRKQVPRARNPDCEEIETRRVSEGGTAASLTLRVTIPTQISRPQKNSQTPRF